MTDEELDGLERSSASDVAIRSLDAHGGNPGTERRIQLLHDHARELIDAAKFKRDVDRCADATAQRIRPEDLAFLLAWNRRQR